MIHTTERLQALVVLMHSPTSELTRCFIHPSAPLPDHDNANPLTRANLARILLHRAAADPAAKAFVTGHRAWLGRVLARNGARDESVRERCFGGSRQHPLASPTGGWDGQPPLGSPRVEAAAGGRTPATDPPPTTTPDSTTPAPHNKSPGWSPTADPPCAAGIAYESDDPFDTPHAAQLLATPPRSWRTAAGDGGHCAGGDAAARGDEAPGGDGFPGSQVITQSF